MQRQHPQALNPPVIYDYNSHAFFVAHCEWQEDSAALPQIAISRLCASIVH